MKKLFTVAILGLLTTGAFAQTGQGIKVISGTVGLTIYSDKQKDNNNDRVYSDNILTLNPSFGYLLKDNLEAGIVLGYSYRKYESELEGEFSDFRSISKQNTYRFSPYLKKYFPVSANVALSTRLAAGVSMGRSKQESMTDHTSTSKYKSSGYFANIVPGISYFPAEKIGLSASFGELGYSKMTSDDENGNSGTTGKSFVLDLSSSTFGIGFSYHF